MSDTRLYYRLELAVNALLQRAYKSDSADLAWRKQFEPKKKIDPKAATGVNLNLFETGLYAATCEIESEMKRLQEERFRLADLEDVKALIRTYESKRMVLQLLLDTCLAERCPKLKNGCNEVGTGFEIGHIERRVVKEESIDQVSQEIGNAIRAHLSDLGFKVSS